jgi:hypothetical protein
MVERDMDPFEARLAQRLEAYAAIPVRPVDADAIASAVIARRRRPWVSHWLDTARLPTLAWIVVALAAAIAGGLFIGSLLQQLHSHPRQPLVLATETGLYVGEVGQRPETGLTLLRDDGSWIEPRWSPAGDRIAVLHGQPIPPQAGTAGAPPNTAMPFALGAAALIVLDDQGSTLQTWPGPVVDFAWSPVAPDGTSLLAFKRSDGELTVVDEAARVVGDVATAPVPADAPSEPLLLPARIAWASPNVVLFADGDHVSALDLARPGASVPVAAAGPSAPPGSRVTALATTSDGRHIAFIVAPCEAGCLGQVRIAILPSGYASPNGAVPRGRDILVSVEAATGLTWTDDGRWVFAWPLLASAAQHTAPRRAVVNSVLEGRDTVAAWTRLAGDGSGRLIVMNSFPAFNDRHFDAWLVDPDGVATRVAARSLGLDLRATGGGSWSGSDQDRKP